MAAFPLAAAISAGGQIIGSLFNKPDKPKVYTPREQIESAVSAARDLGIHPLAALGSGAGYTQVSSPSSPNVGSAIGAGLDRFGQMLATENSELQNEALKADIESRRAQAELYRSQSRTLISKAASNAQGGPGDDSLPVPKTIRIGGVPLKRDPSKFSSAQDAQDEYGDLVEQIVGVPAFIDSAGRHIRSKTEASRWFKPRSMKGRQWAY